MKAESIKAVLINDDLFFVINGVIQKADGWAPVAWESEFEGREDLEAVAFIWGLATLRGS